jgi:hypothetical protein
LGSLLRLHLIPEGERSEALQHVIRRGLRHLPNDIDFETLAGHGFLDELEELICEENLLSEFGWANRSAGLVVKLLDARPRFTLFAPLTTTR